jgi:hypothetical protein
MKFYKMTPVTIDLVKERRYVAMHDAHWLNIPRRKRGAALKRKSELRKWHTPADCARLHQLLDLVEKGKLMDAVAATRKWPGSLREAISEEIWDMLWNVSRDEARYLIMAE